jgi:hypothetical protein
MTIKFWILGMLFAPSLLLALSAMLRDAFRKPASD